MNGIDTEERENFHVYKLTSPSCIEELCSELSDQDSNLDYTDQNRMCSHYTIRQGGFLKYEGESNAEFLRNQNPKHSKEIILIKIPNIAVRKNVYEDT